MTTILKSPTETLRNRQRAHVRRPGRPQSDHTPSVVWRPAPLQRRAASTFQLPPPDRNIHHSRADDSGRHRWEPWCADPPVE